MQMPVFLFSPAALPSVAVDGGGRVPLCRHPPLSPPSPPPPPTRHRLCRRLLRQVLQAYRQLNPTRPDLRDVVEQFLVAFLYLRLGVLPPGTRAAILSRRFSIPSGHVRMAPSCKL